MVATSDLDFESWYVQLHPRLVAALAASTGEPDVSRDAADEAVARALERWPRVSRMDSPTGWTFRVAFNVARRRLRRRAFERRVFARAQDRHLDQRERFPGGELWLLVADLPPRQRHAVALRHVAQLTEPEIASVMGISRGTVSSTLRAAHRNLKLAITADDPVEEARP